MNNQRFALLIFAPVFPVLACFGAFFSLPFSAQAQDRADTACQEAVQGKIAWNYDGDKRWNERNIQRLCTSAVDSREPARCFQEIMHGGVDWGGGTRWEWENALDLCQGTRDADATVDCFRDRVNKGLSWKEAIQACRWNQDDTNGGDDRGEGEAGDAIQAKYRALEGASGPLGRPVDPVRTNPRDTGKRRKYERGHIYWSAGTGAHVIYDGPTWEKWADQKWEQGRLGYPIEDPKVNPDETGKRQRFEQGYIYWHPRTGAHIIYEGPIWEQWADQRWEQGGLGYPVADPEPNPTGPGQMQRFEGGALLSFEQEKTINAWQQAGRRDFVIRPEAEAEHCVADVPAAFNAITFGRSNGRNFYTHHVGAADVGDKWGKVGMGGHMQGVARLPGGWLAQAHSKGLFLTHFPGQDGSGYDAWDAGPQDGVPAFPDVPDVSRDHVGGLHAYGNILVLPSDHRVEIFRHRSGNLERLSVFDVSDYQKGAHFASILPLTSGNWLLAVGRDSRKRRKAHRIHFYVIPRLDAPQGALRYLGRRGRGRTREDFQSGSLIADCDGDVFVIGTGVRVVQANTHAKLYRVVSFSRDGGGRPNRAELVKVNERSPDSERNDCSLNAAATFFSTADRALAMYCTEKEIRNGQITTREYRDENR